MGVGVGVWVQRLKGPEMVGLSCPSQAWAKDSGAFCSSIYDAALDSPEQITPPLEGS